MAPARDERLPPRLAEVDIDIRPGLAFDALPALRREEVDLVVSSDPEDSPASPSPPSSTTSPCWSSPADPPRSRPSRQSSRGTSRRDADRLPVDRARLDVFTEWLDPAGVEPRAVRPVELTAMILLLVASGRGVAVLPDWVVRAAARADMELATRRLRATAPPSSSASMPRPATPTRPAPTSPT
jgi:LysR family transcriptional regulator for metE and metH